MAEYEPTSTSDYQKQCRLLKLMKLWEQKSSSIPTPEESLRLEHNKWAREKRKAREEALCCVAGDQEVVDRFNRAADRESDCAAKLAALEPGCDCKARERRETYEQELAKVQRKYGFPFRLVPDLVLRSPSPSPAPGPTPPAATARTTLPPPDSVGGESASRRVWQTPRTSGGEGGRDSLAGTDRPDNGAEYAFEAGPASSATGAAITVNGDSSAIADVRSAAGAARVANRKRKATQHSLIRTFPVSSKRLRLIESKTDVATTTIPIDDEQGDPDVEPDPEAESESEFEANTDTESEVDVDPRPQETEAQLPRFASQRDIDFNEVYQNGHARYKHHIVEHEGRFYILRCDECEMHFNDSPLKGAGRHLDSKKHGWMFRGHAVVVKVLGIEVLNCNRERQKTNNDEFKLALEAGYRVYRKPSSARARGPQPQEQAQEESRQQANITNSRRRNRRATGEAVLDPVPGKIYLAFWRGLGRVAVIVLPRGCFGDPSFGEVGLDGSSLAEDTDLLEKDVPECYRVSPETRKITGWQDGYEDGGEKVRERKYPVMYFDGVDGFLKSSVGWMSVGDLEEYDPDSFAGNGDLIANYAHLRKFEKERERAKEAAEKQADAPATEGHRSETPEPDLYSASPRPVQPTEAIEPPPEMASPNRAAPDPPEPQPSATDDRPDERRSGEGPSVAPNLDWFGSLTSPPLPRPFSTDAAIRPTRENIVGHAPTRGDRAPPRDPGTRGDELFARWPEGSNCGRSPERGVSGPRRGRYAGFTSSAAPISGGTGGRPGAWAARTDFAGVNEGLDAPQAPGIQPRLQASTIDFIALINDLREE